MPIYVPPLRTEKSTRGYTESRGINAASFTTVVCLSTIPPERTEMSSHSFSSVSIYVSYLQGNRDINVQLFQRVNLYIISHKETERLTRSVNSAIYFSFIAKVHDTGALDSTHGAVKSTAVLTRCCRRTAVPVYDTGSIPAWNHAVLLTYCWKAKQTNDGSSSAHRA